MEEVNVVSGQTVLSEGEVPKFFFFIKEGKFRMGSEIYHSGSFVAIVEYFLEDELVSDMVAESDSVIRKYTKDDVMGEDEEYKNVLKFLVESLNASLVSYIEKEVIGDFEKSVDVAKIASIMDKTEGEEEVLEALEEMLSIQKLPELPDDPEKAKAVVDMTSKEEDIIRYVLHRLAFVKKFPANPESKEFIIDAIRIYMDEMEDRYGAMYSAKLAMLFYPDDDEIMREVMHRSIKISRLSKDPEWFEYLIRFLMRFPKEEVKIDEIS